MEGCMSNISYDNERDKITVDTEFSHELFRMRRKYGNYIDIAEEAEIVINQIEEEEKERKEAEKAQKAAAREGVTRAERRTRLGNEPLRRLQDNIRTL